MKENIRVTVIVPHYNYVQILTHGCYYTCRTDVVDGIECFRFKDKWYPIDEYTTDTTTINTVGE